MRWIEQCSVIWYRYDFNSVYMLHMMKHVLSFPVCLYVSVCIYMYMYRCHSTEFAAHPSQLFFQVVSNLMTGILISLHTVVWLMLRALVLHFFILYSVYLRVYLRLKCIVIKCSIIHFSEAIKLSVYKCNMGLYV